MVDVPEQRVRRQREEQSHGYRKPPLHAKKHEAPSRDNRAEHDHDHPAHVDAETRVARDQVDDPDDGLIDVGVRRVLNLLEHAGRGEPWMDPPPAVVDRPLDLHQVLDGVACEGQGNSKVATPACEDDEEDHEDDGGLCQEGEKSLPMLRSRAAGHALRYRRLPIAPLGPLDQKVTAFEKLQQTAREATTVSRRDLEPWEADLRFWYCALAGEKSCENEVLILPSSETDPYAGSSPHPDTLERRALTLWRLARHSTSRSTICRS